MRRPGAGSARGRGQTAPKPKARGSRGLRAGVESGPVGLWAYPSGSYAVAQYLNDSLGLHCLLYLSADRVCVRAIEPYLEPVKTLGRWWMGDDRWKRISVPCLPEVKVRRMELASKLMLAALLECRDAGRVELRPAEPETGLLRLLGPPYDRAVVKARPGPFVEGFCGWILIRLGRYGERGVRTMFNGLGGKPRMFSRDNYGGDWVIAKVGSELADRGYARRAEDGAVILDCERIQTLAEECALAVDRWNRAWAADPQLCDALVTDCAKAIKPPPSGGGA